MTMMAGNGPLPSGSARKALISSSPDLMVIFAVLTFPSAAHAGATSASTAHTPRKRRMVVSSSNGQIGSDEPLHAMRCCSDFVACGLARTTLSRKRPSRRESQFQHLIHALGHVLQFLRSAAADFGRRPAVVANFRQRLENVRPILIAFADPHPLFALAVTLEIELEHAFTEFANPIARLDAILNHVAAIEICTDAVRFELIHVLNKLLRLGDEIVPHDLN